MTARKLLGLFVASLALLAQPVSAKRAPPTLPQVSAPIPVNKTSKPFVYAQKAVDGVGYDEEEYFLTATANVYDWARSGHKVEAVAGR